jgi:MFS family permease
MPPKADRNDRRRLTALVLVFGTSLGITAFAYPLLALEAGLGVTAVGLLAALSAAVQIIARLSLPALLARFKDRSLMVFSLGVMVISASILIFTAALFGFVVAQIAQGLARGIFHTASQTHSVRIPGIPARRLAFVQTMAQLGRFIGPGLAGSLAVVSFEASLWAAVGLAVGGVVLGLSLDPIPPYQRVPSAQRTPIWKRSGLGRGCWGGAVGGTWRGVAESFVPVLLSRAGLPASVIGWMLSGADGTSFLTTASVSKWGRTNIGRFVPLAAAGLSIALLLLPLASGILPLGALMMVAGSAGGVAGVLGTAAANATVEQSEQGAAIALVGTYRAATRFAAPALVSGAASLFALPAALAIVAVGILAPITWLGRPTRLPAGRR